MFSPDQSFLWALPDKINRHLFVRSLPLNNNAARTRPTPWEIFTTWMILGIQSFGGGTSTFYLIHQVCVERGWLDEEEFIRTWALAQISPGINLLKLTVLVGHGLCGWPGLLAGVAGLLLPSASVTILMTAGFSLIRQQPLVQAAMRGILPATIGLSLAMGVQMGQPLLTRAYREGPLRLSASLATLAGAGSLLAFTSISPVIVLLLSGAAGIVLMAVIPVKPARKEKPA
jgi:chromate transporter